MARFVCEESAGRICPRSFWGLCLPWCMFLWLGRWWGSVVACMEEVEEFPQAVKSYPIPTDDVSRHWANNSGTTGFNFILHVTATADSSSQVITRESISLAINSWQFKRGILPKIHRHRRRVQSKLCKYYVHDCPV